MCSGGSSCPPSTRFRSHACTRKINQSKANVLRDEDFKKIGANNSGAYELTRGGRNVPSLSLQLGMILTPCSPKREMLPSDFFEDATLDSLFRTLLIPPSSLLLLLPPLLPPLLLLLPPLLPLLPLLLPLLLLGPTISELLFRSLPVDFFS